MKIFISILVSCIAVFGVQTIEMTKKQQDDLGVKTQEVTNIESISFGPYNGTVVLQRKDIISISSNVESLIKGIYVKKFQEVKKGEKLLTIGSNELLNLQKEYIEALIESEVIDSNYDRNLKLQSEGIISHKKLLVSKKEKLNSDLHLKLTANYLLSSGFNNAMLQKIKRTHIPIMEINFLAPRKGVIYDIDINIGEVVSSDRSMIKMYADGKRFIEMTVPVKMIENISIGDRCDFSSYSANITNIGSVVNSDSQSVQVRALIKDSKEIMINRVYGVNIYKKIDNAVKIKKGALVFEDGSTYVFKQIEEGFEVLSVEVISEGPVCYIVKADLKKSDRVAVTSTSALLGGMESSDE